MNKVHKTGVTRVVRSVRSKFIWLLVPFRECKSFKGSLQCLIQSDVLEMLILVAVAHFQVLICGKRWDHHIPFGKSVRLGFQIMEELLTLGSEVA
jgi:hypothetical protein